MRRQLPGRRRFGAMSAAAAAAVVTTATLAVSLGAPQAHAAQTIANSVTKVSTSTQVVTTIDASSASASAKRVGKIVVGPGTAVIIIDRIEGNKAWGAECTVGWTGIGALNARSAITAGHCGKVGQQVLVGHSIVGIVSRSSNPATRAADNGEGDIAVDPSQPDWSTITFNPVAVRLVAGIKPIMPVRSGIAKIGDRVCHLGVTTGYHCGKVIGREGPWVYTNIDAAPGDSGGPLIRAADRAAVGILVGGLYDKKTNKKLNITRYYAVTPVLGTTRLRLATVGRV